jgi:hypothetical protein
MIVISRCADTTIVSISPKARMMSDMPGLQESPAAMRKGQGRSALLKFMRFQAVANTAFEQLRFVPRKEALGVCVVVGLISATHTLLESVLLEQPSELRIYVLPATIGMHDQPCRETLAEDCFL